MCLVTLAPSSIPFSSLPSVGKINVEPSKSAPPAVGSVLLGMYCLGQGRCRRGMPGGTSVLRVQGGGGGTLQALRYQPWSSGSTLPCSATPSAALLRGSGVATHRQWITRLLFYFVSIKK